MPKSKSEPATALERIEVQVAAGVRIATAIKEVLEVEHGLSLSTFARQRRLTRSALSAAISGMRPALPEHWESLAKVLGGTGEEWRALLLRSREELLERERAVCV